MPLLDEIQKYAYPFDDIPELSKLKEEEKVTVSFQCRYCDVTFEWTVPLETKIKKWRCPHCYLSNAIYV